MRNMIYVCSGRSQSLKAWAEEWGLKYSCLQRRHLARKSNLRSIDVTDLIRRGIITRDEWVSYKSGDFGEHLKRSRMYLYKRLNTDYKDLKYGSFLRVA